MKNLNLRVHAANELNKVSKKELQSVLTQLEKYKGEKIYNIDNSLTKKTPVKHLKHIVKPFNRGHAITQSIYLKNTGHSLWLNITVCLNGGSYEDKTNYCIYLKKSFYLGKLDNNILVDVENFDKLSENYNLSKRINSKTEQAKINKSIKLHKELENVRNSILIDTEKYELR